MLAFSGLCLAAANLARAQLVPPTDAYEWADPDYDPWNPDPINADDAANWLSPDDSAPLPVDGAHLNFGTKPAIAAGYWADQGYWDDDAEEWVEILKWVPGTYYEGEVAGLGDAPLPARYASLWFGFGAPDDSFDMYTSYTLTGSAITVGYGTDEIDRLIAARGLGLHTLDLDVLIHDVPGLAFRIHNELVFRWSDELIFAQTLTSYGTLIFSGFGKTSVNELHGTGELIKEGAGLLRLADAASYTGAVTIRGGALVGALNDDSALTLAGGVYGGGDDGGPIHFARDFGDGAGQVRWLAGKSGGFTVHDGAELHITLGGGSPLTWGQTDFVSLGSELLFGSATANGSIHWNNVLFLGDPGNGSARTIRLNRAPDKDFELHLSEEILAAPDQTLRFIGSGTVVVSAANGGFRGDLEIAGVELSLRDGGRFTQATSLTVHEGGTLAISFEASGGPPPLSGTATITLSSGALHWDDPYTVGFARTLGDLVITGGANQIKRTSLTNGLRLKSLTRAAPPDGSDPRSTLLVSVLANASSATSLLEFDDLSVIEGTAIGGIHPWLVVTVGPIDYASRSDWGIFEDGSLKRYVNYYEGGEGTWAAGHNVNIGTGTVFLSDDRTINSLRIDNRVLRLEGRALTIGSGGILVGSNSFGSIYDAGNGSTFGAITTAGGRPLYIQAHSDLYFAAKITGGIDLVKTGAGSLNLASANYDNSGHANELGSIHIHQGDLWLGDGARIATTGTIYVGDGGSHAALILGQGWDEGTPILSGKREVRLRGGHDNNKAAELRLVGEHDLRLEHLSISGNSVLEFQLPWNGGTSKIYSELFTFETASSRLLVKGWVQEEGGGPGGEGGLMNAKITHILVRKTSPGLDDYLRQIWFNDYGPATKINWFEDDRYWEIVPGIAEPAPEPSTYGAILASSGDRAGSVAEEENACCRLKIIKRNAS